MVRKKILITDFHAGCQMWQYFVLQQIGFDVTIYSLSGHHHLLKQFKINYKVISANYYKNNKNDLLQYDYFLISFWPSHVIYPFNFYKFSEENNKSIILNCGHRFKIHTSPEKHIEMIKTLYLLHKNNKHVLAVMSEYDYHYIYHYTGIKPIKLLCFSHHLNEYLSCTSIFAQQYSNTILIGPAHNKHIIVPFNNIYDFNKKLLEYSKKNNIGNIDVNYIKNIYPHYNYNDLMKHKACILYPYSVFSISTIELYNLNIPIFVPSIELLVKYNICNDRSVFPVYSSRKKYDLCKYTIKQFKYKYSPNSYKEDDVEYWLQYIYLYQKKYIIIFNSESDLINKIYSLNFNKIRENMIIENNEEKLKSITDWKNLNL